MRALTAILGFMILSSFAVSGEESIVWQIGKFDNGYSELAMAGEYSAYSHRFPDGVTYRVGRDDAAKSWSYVQPGPSDAWAGSTCHASEIAFEIPNEPKGVYTLVVDLVNTHYSNPPLLEISINGRGDRVQLPSGSGDESLRDASKGKAYELRLPLPAEMFRRGENIIRLSSVAGSWLIYDALSLSNDPEGTPPPPEIRSLTVRPTSRFVRRGQALKQVLDVSLEVSVLSPRPLVRVKAGDRVTQTLLDPSFMGIIREEILVDEVTSPTPVEVTVSCGGQSRTATVELTPKRHWKLYVQPSSHVDIGYTDWQERVIELHNRNMSLALDLCEKYPDFRWNTEAAWVQDNYLSLMPDDRKTQFVKQAKAGHIGCQAIYGNMLTGIESHEEIIRGLYYAKAMSKKYGIPYDIAMSSDVPTQVWTLPMVLAGAGIKYFSAGLNLTRGDSFNKLFNRPFYWQGPDGSRVLTWFSPGYAYASHLGLLADMDRACAQIESHLAAFDRDDYPYDAVLAFGGVGDNQPINPSLAEIAHEWNKKYAYPQIILCRGPEFFRYIESRFGDRIPTYSGCGGVYWEDGAASSAVETAKVQQAKARLSAAERMLATGAALGKTEYPRADMNEAWKNVLLYDEHTWGAHCSISQPEHEQTIHQWEYKARFAQEAERQAESLAGLGMQAIAELISPAEPCILVYNPLDRPASGFIHTEIAGEQGTKRVMLWAENVPPLSWKTYPVKNLPASAEPSGEPGHVIENRYYRIEADTTTGALKSVYDKELKKELVDPNAPYGFNEYVYIAGQGKDAKDMTRAVKRPVPTTMIYKWPGYQSLLIGTSGYKTPYCGVEIRLYDRMKRIDFINRLRKEATYDKEAGYFAFPLALQNPEWYVEIANGVVRPKKDMLPGACMSWYCTQDFVAAADDGCAVVWTAVDSPLITIGDINRETFQSPLPIENGHLYAYVFNNYWFTNYKASQGGEMVFRFSLTSMKRYDASVASRFGQAVKNPLVAGVVRPGSPARASQSPKPFISVEPWNVTIQAVKQAESGGGIIIRLRELSGRETSATISLPAGVFGEAWSCNLVEDPLSGLKIVEDRVSVTVPAKGLATILVK